MNRKRVTPSNDLTQEEVLNLPHNFTKNFEKIEDKYSFRLTKLESPFDNLKWIVRISSSKRVRWDILIILLAIYNCFTLPLFLAFMPSILDSTIVRVLEITIDILFLTDIVINFRTTYIDNLSKEEIVSPKLIAKNYVSSGAFFLDLLASIPFDTVSSILNQDNEQLALLSTLKLLRILRLSKIIMFMRVKQSVKLSFKLFQLMSILILYTHMGACFWFILIKQPEVWIPPTDFINLETDLFTAPVHKQYWYSAYHSVFLLVGAEAAPRTLGETVFASFMILFGAIITAIMFGEMAVVMTSLRKSDTKFNEMHDSITTAMKNMRLDDALQFKILGFLASVYALLEKQNEYSNFMKNIPPSLQKKINKFIYSNIFSGNPIFTGNPEVVGYCVFRLQNKFYQPEFMIIDQFGEATEFFFIAKGTCTVEVMSTDKVHENEQDWKRVKILGENEYFGEIALLYETTRTARVATVNYTTLGVLSKEQFEDMVAKFPDVKKLLKDSILEYNDPWKNNLKKLFYKVPYLRNASKEAIQYMSYTLPYQSFPKGSFMFKEGETTQKAFFVLEGKFMVSIILKNKDISSILDPKNTKAKLDWNLYGVIKQPKERAKKIEFDLVEGGTGCILCSKQLIIGSKQSVSCKARKSVRALVLDSEYLQKLMKKFPELKKGFHHISKSLHKYDNFREEFVPLDLPIDVYCPSKACKDKTYFRKYLTLKKAFVKAIYKKRKAKNSGIKNMKSMIEKLKAVMIAEEKGKADIGKKIATGEISIEAVFGLDMLKLDELYSPIKTQFAARAFEISSLVKFIYDQFNVSVERVDLLEEKCERLASTIYEVQELMDRAIKKTQKKENSSISNL